MMVYRKGYNRKCDGKRVKTAIFYVRLRMADGSLRELSTGCKIKSAASARAVELKSYLVERVRRLTGDCTAFPGAFDGKPLFDGLPEKMSRVFERDCNAAGIPKHDGAGRVIDVHGLRHTFGTMLARAGVPLQVAQRAMRHSTPALTANVYTHLGLMDISGAVNCLPGIPASGEKNGAGEAGETASK